MSKRPSPTLADAMAINRISDRIRAEKQSAPAQKSSVDTSPERLERLARYLDELPPGPTTHIHDLHEETAAALRALLAERDALQGQLNDLRNGWANSVKAHAALLAERDAAFTAGQEEMRERAAAKLDEMGRGVANASAHPMVDKERASSLSKVMHDMAETTRALPIKDKPDE